MVSTRRQAKREEREEWVSGSEGYTSEEDSDLDLVPFISLESHVIDRYPLETERIDRLERELERQRQGCCSKFLGLALPAAVLFFKLAEFALVYTHLK